MLVQGKRLTVGDPQFTAAVKDVVDRRSAKTRASAEIEDPLNAENAEQRLATTAARRS